jgi:hypothetical protein
MSECIRSPHKSGNLSIKAVDEGGETFGNMLLRFICYELSTWHLMPKDYEALRVFLEQTHDDCAWIDYKGTLDAPGPVSITIYVWNSWLHDGLPKTPRSLILR